MATKLSRLPPVITRGNFFPGGDGAFSPCASGNLTLGGTPPSARTQRTPDAAAKPSTSHCSGDSFKLAPKLEHVDASLTHQVGVDSEKICGTHEKTQLSVCLSFIASLYSFHFPHSTLFGFQPILAGSFEHDIASRSVYFNINAIHSTLSTLQSLRSSSMETKLSNRFGLSVSPPPRASTHQQSSRQPTVASTSP